MIHATPPPQPPCPASLNRPSETVTMTGVFNLDGVRYRIRAVTVGNCRIVLHVGPQVCTSSATYSPKLGVRKTPITCK